ncbi:of chromosomes protein 6 [Seminavis robusta]|uniref:Of chromosomes protein 6 n=1 Tax=Seminavis robusta TaxID=568900 RepID=A0A9N8HUP6_9STRA|nr:of chromosomes protein 6 [Seminavis robusta]|eukprot:Sro1788_g297590.1 of chromosomes protein 6 (510) ;mRNA; r:5933-7659
MSLLIRECKLLRCAADEPTVGAYDHGIYDSPLEWTESKDAPDALLEEYHEDIWDQQQCSPGMIKSLYIENFMSHRELRIDFSRHTTVICDPTVEHSAVFTAIQLALGASSSQLEVAKHLQELVRTPTAQPLSVGPGIIARVCITLENRGEAGYQKDVYGDEIHVERSISSRVGCYGWRILDMNGVEKSRSKSDLFAMLQYLHIGVDNPATILKQAKAKRVGNPKDMYRFFASASKLDFIEDTYLQVGKEIEKYKALRTDLMEIMTEKIDYVESLKDDWEHERESLLWKPTATKQESEDEGEPKESNIKGALKDAIEMMDSVKENFSKMKELETSKSIFCKNYWKAKVEQEAMMDHINVISQQIDRLEEDLISRKKQLKKEQNYVVTMASVCYDECLQTMDCMGKVVVDFAKGELTLVSKKKKKRIKMDDRIVDAKEKDEAFKSMSFLMAISQPLGYPVQCTLLHPKNCVDLLERSLACTQKFPNRQFMFVLPENVPQLRDNMHLKVVKL